ncbi:hypothetical protein THAOC_15485, partial [Thalassiosira oceanica]
MIVADLFGVVLLMLENECVWPKDAARAAIATSLMVGLTHPVHGSLLQRLASLTASATIQSSLTSGCIETRQMLEVTGYLLGMPLHPSTRISCESWETRLQRVASDSLSYSGPPLAISGWARVGTTGRGRARGRGLELS